MNFKFLVPAVALVCCATAHAQQPDADAILKGARLAATLVNLEKDVPLNGNLSKDGKKIPIALYLKGKNIQFQFMQDNGQWHIFHMRLSEDRYDLFELVGDKTIPFPPDKLTYPIAGTDLTYEDLALRFFYWPNPKLEGQEEVGGQPCYKLRIEKPKGSAGKYDVVYVWVHSKFGAFMKIRGHDKNGGLVKEFQVEDIMKVTDDVWTLRTMQVATHDPATGRRISITDVTFESPKKLAPRGLR
jgi:hypothetical protein